MRCHHLRIGGAGFSGKPLFVSPLSTACHASFGFAACLRGYAIGLPMKIEWIDILKFSHVSPLQGLPAPDSRREIRRELASFQSIENRDAG